MKTWHHLVLASPLAALPLQTAAAADIRDWSVSDRGPSHRTWQRVSQYEAANGRTIYRTNSFVELQTGLHRWDQGWVETSPEIELFQDGAVVRHLLYQVAFAPNLASRGSIDLLLPDQSRLTGHILGVA